METHHSNKAGNIMSRGIRKKKTFMQNNVNITYTSLDITLINIKINILNIPFVFLFIESTSFGLCLRKLISSLTFKFISQVASRGFVS